MTCEKTGHFVYADFTGKCCRNFIDGNFCDLFRCDGSLRDHLVGGAVGRVVCVYQVLVTVDVVVYRHFAAGNRHVERDLPVEDIFGACQCVGRKRHRSCRAFEPEENSVPAFCHGHSVSGKFEGNHIGDVRIEGIDRFGIPFETDEFTYILLPEMKRRGEFVAIRR